MNRLEKIEAAKRHIAGKIGDIIEKNYDEFGGALVTAGTFTVLLEAYHACEISAAYAAGKGPVG